MEDRGPACCARAGSGWGPASRASLGVLAVLVSLALGASPALAKPPSARGLVDEYAAIEATHLGETLPGGPAHFITVTESPKFSKIVHE